MAVTLQENFTMVAFVIRVIELHMVGTFPFVTMVVIFTNIIPVILWLPTLCLFLWTFAHIVTEVTNVCRLLWFHKHARSFSLCRNCFIFDSYNSMT